MLMGYGFGNLGNVPRSAWEDWLSWLLALAAGYCILELLLAQLQITLFDPEEYPRPRKSLSRSAILGLANVGELILAWAVILMHAAASPHGRNPLQSGATHKPDTNLTHT